MNPTAKRLFKLILNALDTLIERAIRTLPNRVLRRLEETVQRAQGKGWGAKTESAEVHAVLSQLPPASRRRPIALDVGANVGSWTAPLLDEAPDARVYCFEPSTVAFGHLADRFSGDERVHCERVAVGDRVGTARLWADTPGSRLGSLSKRRLDHIDIDFSHSEEVPVLTLDSWLAENPLRPNLLKIDVEGHELAVLQGATELLKSVEVVQFEFGGCNIDSRTYFQDFFYFFRDAGFRLYRLGPKGLQPLDAYDCILDESFSPTNFIAQRR